MSKLRPIYADFAAATPTDPSVISAMLPYFGDNFGNPASAHSFGKKAEEAVAFARETIAKFIGGSPSGIFFTASATESSNLAIQGVAKANKKVGRHIITTAIEHPATLNTCRALEKDGWKVTYLSVDKFGCINLANLKDSLTPTTVLVTTHFGNSEAGTLQNIETIAKLCKKNKTFLHVDACQAMSYCPIDVAKMGIDLLTFNSSKLYGPKGVAVLYVREGLDIFPIIYGGGQQQSLRSGTENVPGIVGLAKAVEVASQHQINDAQRVAKLRDLLQFSIADTKNIKINFVAATRLPNFLSVTYTNLYNQDIVKLFNDNGVAISSGSACSSKSLINSRALAALGLSAQEIQATARISLGRTTTVLDISKIAQVIKKISLG